MRLTGSIFSETVADGRTVLGRTRPDQRPIDGDHLAGGRHGREEGARAGNRERAGSRGQSSGSGVALFWGRCRSARPWCCQQTRTRNRGGLEVSSSTTVQSVWGACRGRSSSPADTASVSCLAPVSTAPAYPCVLRILLLSERLTHVRLRVARASLQAMSAWHPQRITTADAHSAGKNTSWTRTRSSLGAIAFAKAIAPGERAVRTVRAENSVAS